MNQYRILLLVNFIFSIIDNGTIGKTGKVSMNWQYNRPTMVIMDPELMRMMLTLKIDHFVTYSDNPLGSLLTKGLSYLQGDKWEKRRKFLTPVFHYEKLKVMLIITNFFYVEGNNFLEKLIYIYI